MSVLKVSTYIITSITAHTIKLTAKQATISILSFITTVILYVSKESSVVFLFMVSI